MTPYFSLGFEQKEQRDTQMGLSIGLTYDAFVRGQRLCHSDKGHNWFRDALIRVKRRTSRQRHSRETDNEASTTRLIAEGMIGGVTVIKVIGQYRRGRLHVKKLPFR